MGVNSEAPSAAVPRWFQWMAGTLLCVGFLWFVAPGWRARFTPDDIMNLFLAWQPSWPELLAQVALPWRPGLRPLGGALYRASFDLFGFDLTAVRILLLCLVAFNVWLTALVARKLTGSSWAGWFAAAFATYHVHFQALYWNTGACYDIMAFTCIWSCALLLLQARYERLRAWQWTAAALLFSLGLGAKEIALALPAMLLAFELLPGRRQWIPLACASVLSIAFVFGRLYAGGGIVSIQGYRPEYTPAAYFRSLTVMFGDLVYLRDQISVAQALTLVGLLAWLAASTRTRGAWAALLCLLLGAVPVALVPPRGLYAWYLPLAGLWILLGAALVRIPLTKSILWLILAGALFLFHSGAAPRLPQFVLEEQREIARVIEALDRSKFPATPGRDYLLVSDPFQGKSWGDWKSAMLIQLHTRRRDLYVHYPHMPDQPRNLIRIAWNGDRFAPVESAQPR